MWSLCGNEARDHRYRPLAGISCNLIIMSEYVIYQFPSPCGEKLKFMNDWMREVDYALPSPYGDKL